MKKEKKHKINEDEQEVKEKKHEENYGTNLYFNSYNSLFQF